MPNLKADFIALRGAMLLLPGSSGTSRNDFYGAATVGSRVGDSI
jgi:hypothetical protein